MPSPLIIPISGVLNASGAGTVVMPQAVLQWSRVAIHLQAAKSPTAQWQVGKIVSNAMAQLLDTVGGPSVRSGPYTLAPNELLGAIITGGKPNDVISGTIIGAQGIDPTNVPADATSGTTVAVGTSPLNDKLLGQVSAGPNSTQTTPFVLDQNVVALYIDVLAGANLTNITITDLDNSRTLFNGTTSGPITVFSGTTINIQVAVTAGLGGTSAQVAIYELFTPVLAPTIQADVTDRASRQLGVISAPSIMTGYSATRYSPAASTPTVIQVANSARKAFTIQQNTSGTVAIDLYGNIAVTAGSGVGLFISIPIAGYFELFRMPSIYSDKLQEQNFGAAADFFVVEWT